MSDPSFSQISEHSNLEPDADVDVDSNPSLTTVNEAPSVDCGDSSVGSSSSRIPQAPDTTTHVDGSAGSSEALARGISTLLAGVIRDFDSKAENASKSQDQLSDNLDRLTRELDQLLEDAPVPFIMQHATRISGVRKRVSAMNLLLKSIQRRVDNMDRMLSTGLQHGHEKPKMDGSKRH